MNQESISPIKVIFIHIMRENFSGAQKNIYRLLINLAKERVQSIILGQTESPLTRLITKENIEKMIVPFPPELEIYDQQILKFNVKHV